MSQCQLCWLALPRVLDVCVQASFAQSWCCDICLTVIFLILLVESRDILINILFCLWHWKVICKCSPLDSSSVKQKTQSLLTSTVLKRKRRLSFSTKIIMTLTAKTGPWQTHSAKSKSFRNNFCSMIIIDYIIDYYGKTSRTTWHFFYVAREWGTMHPFS